MNLRTIVESHFEIARDRCHGDEIVFICPEPGCGDRSGNRSVNSKTRRTSCWRCGKGGDFFRWANRLGYDLATEDLDFMEKAEERLTDVAKKEQNAVKSTVIYVNDVKLPAGFIPVKNEPKSFYARAIRDMAERKNLGWKDMVKAGVGFTRSSEWEPFAIFPVTEWNRTVYYQGRTYIDTPGQSTKKFPSKKVVPTGSSQWVYNIDKLRQGASVAIVVESILNVLSLEKELEHQGVEGIVPIAIFKHKISSPQWEKIKGCRHLKEVCLMFDDDALAEAQQTASTYVNHCKLTVVEMPKGVDANDDARMAMERFKTRVAYTAPIRRLEALAKNLRPK